MMYISSQINDIFIMQSAGMVNEIRRVGRWLASGSKKEVFQKGFAKDYNSWTDKVQGDRITQLVIIGSGLDKNGITKSLDDCLISEEEYAQLKKKTRIDCKDYVGDDENDFDPFAPVEFED